jgi:demethylmenaquinone methyltransferase/2-methoxy-6-polyprenyl-1,4-benzoquinol methylase
MTEYTKEDPKTIEAMFDKIAPQYDKANSLMSMNLHKKWNAKLTQTALEKETKSYLDLCTGTGEIAFNLMKDNHRDCEAFLLDFSDNMLQCAKSKAATLGFTRHRIHYLHADAQTIPLPSESIDTVTIAYGIRNVQNTEKCVKEVYRVLRKGGLFAILELTQPKNHLMKLGHKFYMKALLPVVGKFIAYDKQAYCYLRNSIQEFLIPEELEKILKNNGFLETKIDPINCGIATILTGRKR